MRSLLDAWWAWAGMVTQRGEVVDSAAFVSQRHGQGLLELSPVEAERAIELDVVYLQGLAVRRRAAAPRPSLPVWLLFGATMLVLAILIAASIELGEAAPHVALPGGRAHADTDAYRAWLGLLLGGAGTLAAGLAAFRRPSLRSALAVPSVGLAALALFALGLLAGARWLEWSAGLLFAIAGLAAWLRLRAAA